MKFNLCSSKGYNQWMSWAVICLEMRFLSFANHTVPAEALGKSFIWMQGWVLLHQSLETLHKLCFSQQVSFTLLAEFIYKHIQSVASQNEWTETINKNYSSILHPLISKFCLWLLCVSWRDNSQKINLLIWILTQSERTMKHQIKFDA